MQDKEARLSSEGKGGGESEDEEMLEMQLRLAALESTLSKGRTKGMGMILLNFKSFLICDNVVFVISLALYKVRPLVTSEILYLQLQFHFFFPWLG